MLLKVNAAVLHSAQSTVLRICVPTRFGIKLYPHFQKMQRNCLLNWMKNRALNIPRAPGTVPFSTGASNKSFYAYSLTGRRAGCQGDTANRQKWRLNGN